MNKLIELLDNNTSESGSWLLYRNEHKEVYQKLKDEHLDVKDFASEEDMRLCLKTDNCYALVWYKDTPVGFYRFYASNVNLIQNYVEELINE